MARKWRWAAVVVGAALVVYAAAGVVLCESAIRVPGRPAPAVPFPGASWRAVQMTARDGAVLRGWLYSPAKPNGNCVLALHGIADSRSGQIGLARLFAEHGYTVLTPDSRGHGESGGGIVTYGLRETGDVQQWLDWLIASEHPRQVFGMGESLGAGVLLQSLAVEHRFGAVVAECPFASFREVAEDRVAQRVPHVFAPPLVWSGFWYARLRYGLDFRAASPENTFGGITTPVLLIHGLADTNIDPEHSRRLAARNPSVQLWLVPGARHCSLRRRARGVRAPRPGLVQRTFAVEFLREANQNADRSGQAESIFRTSGRRTRRGDECGAGAHRRKAWAV